ncbi:MutS domain V [Lachnospiraceae bacterium C7]|nr:MutS domain V [Lachnospiraceae bacterium C7]
MNNKKFSILYPDNGAKFKKLSDVAVHDLGMDIICKRVSMKEQEQNLIMGIISNMSDDPYVTKYRCDIFDDILKNKSMREELMSILDKINFLREYGSSKHNMDSEIGTWDLLHQLEEIRDYIKCIEAIYSCLENADLHSDGLLGLKKYVSDLYNDNGFKELKEDIANLKCDTSNLKSVTVGINLNNRFEAESIGLISVNSKQFTKSNLIGNFCDRFSTKDNIKDTLEWKDNYRYNQLSESDAATFNKVLNKSAVNTMVANSSATTLGIIGVIEGSGTEGVTHYMDRITNRLLSHTVKNLRDVLKKYTTLTITNITDLMPEFTYYIRWAEYIENLQKQGAKFAKATVIQELGESNDNARTMHAKGIYNLKLAAIATKEHEEIITNDIDFTDEHRVYILTGANRGGKTTITQAVGQLYLLAQGGIYIPGDSFEFAPVDGIYTHFPADEDQTMDLGRLGEECKRFREIYKEATNKSLMLLNETFSTTSFEEGYYIAKDSVRAIMQKGISTVYNTHMHKLARDIDEMNAEPCKDKAVSLVTKSDEGKRSYKVVICPPSGKSYAKDIAEKYGVTYEMLVE